MTFMVYFRVPQLTFQGQNNLRGMSWLRTGLLLKKGSPPWSKYVSKFTVLWSGWTASCSCSVTASLPDNTVFKSQFSPCVLPLAADAVSGQLRRWQRTVEQVTADSCTGGSGHPSISPRLIISVVRAYCCCGVYADSRTFMLRLVLFELSVTDIVHFSW